SYKIPSHRAPAMMALYLLSGVSAGASDLAYALGPSFYFLFILLSSNMAGLQAVTQDTLLRFSGLGSAFLSICYFLLARFGISGLFDLRRMWRPALLLVGIIGSMLGGFRSNIIILLL